MVYLIILPGACKPQPAGQLQPHARRLLIKFYWNTATSIHLPIVRGCFCSRAELNSRLVCEAQMFTHWPFAEFADSSLGRLAISSAGLSQ